jgi:DNA-binding MarR family transcriptional regulator
MTDLLRTYQFRDRERVGAHGLSVTQTYALEAVLRRGELTPKHLAAELALEKSTVSRLVEAMVAQGLVARTGHPHDARSMLLRPTAKGRRLYSAVRRAIVAENAEVLKGLTHGERAMFVSTLQRFAVAARRRLRGHATG